MASFTFDVECEVEREYPSGDIVPSSVMAEQVMCVRDVNGFITYTRIGHDLLEGLDKKSRDQVIRNICKIYGQEIDEAFEEDQ